MGGFFPLADAHAKNRSGSPRSQEGKSLPIHEYVMGYHVAKHTRRQCGGLECKSKPLRWTVKNVNGVVSAPEASRVELRLYLVCSTPVEPVASL